MSDSARQASPLTMQVVDVSPSFVSAGSQGGIGLNDVVVRMLHDMLVLQRQQVELSREMLQFARDNRQRQQAELEAWQRDNEHVVEKCREVLGILSRVHSGMLSELAEHVRENEETMLESEFSVTEFVDRFGPRLHHLSAILGVLKQVSTPSSSNDQGHGNLAT